MTPRLWVAIAAPSGRLRDALQAILRAMPQVGWVTLLDDNRSLSKAVIERSIDLLLLDMDLPGKQAWLLLEDIKELHVNTFCVALVSTTQERQLATMSGVGAVLTKGFSTRELADAVAQALKPAGGSRRRCGQCSIRAFNG